MPVVEPPRGTRHRSRRPITIVVDPSDKCLDCQSGATSRPPRREDHACRGSDSSSNSLVVTWNLTTSGGVRTTPPGGSRARITFGILPGYNQPDLSAIRSRTGVFGVESRHDAILETGVAPRGVGGGLGQIGRGGSRSGRARVREGPGGDAPATPREVASASTRKESEGGGGEKARLRALEF